MRFEAERCADKPRTNEVDAFTGKRRMSQREESGCHAWTLARIAGHSSVAMSTRYVHPSEDAVLNAMSRLGGHNSGHTENMGLKGSGNPLLAN